MLKDKNLLEDSNLVKEIEVNDAEVITGGGEDCITFDPSNLKVKSVNSRWKIIEGDHHWMMDFDKKEEEAKTALTIIKKYNFHKMCFVGRPDPSMTYFL